MAIPNKQIGWSQESNLLWNISSQLDRLTKVISNFAPPGANIYNSDGVLTGNRTLSGANNDLNLADLNIFKTSIGVNDIGLKLDFSNNGYIIGQSSDTSAGKVKGFFTTSGVNPQCVIGDSDNDITPGNGTALYVLDFTQIIKTTYQYSDIGLKLDFANNNYYLGNFTDNYLRLDLTNGDTTLRASYTIDLNVNDTTQETTLQTRPDYIKSIYNTNDIGLKLDFANSVYQLGTLSGLNTGYIEIAGVSLYQYFNGNIKGIQSEPGLDFYLFGDFNNTNNGTSLSIDDGNTVISTSYGSTQNGIILDYSVDIFQFGKRNGGNTTYLTIDDAAAYPVQVAGTNISSGTAGAASGQFLKIKVGGVDYKIALLNP